MLCLTFCSTEPRPWRFGWWYMLNFLVNLLAWIMSKYLFSRRLIFTNKCLGLKFSILRFLGMMLKYQTPFQEWNPWKKLKETSILLGQRTYKSMMLFTSTIWVSFWILLKRRPYTDKDDGSLLIYSRSFPLLVTMPQTCLSTLNGLFYQVVKRKLTSLQLKR